MVSLGEMSYRTSNAKKNRRFFLNECHFRSMSNFGYGLFIFSLEKHLVPDQWSFDKRHRVFGVRKKQPISPFKCFHRKSRSLRGSRVGTPQFKAHRFHPEARWLLVTNRRVKLRRDGGGLGEPFRPRCNPGGDRKWWDHEQMKQSVPPVCQEKEQDWGGHLRVFFFFVCVCVFIF